MSVTVRVMSLLSITAILLAIAGAFAWINTRFLKLPVTIGLMILALANALLLLLLQQVVPEWTSAAERMMASIDFDKTLMQGMLGYLLFAGALHVDFAQLRNQRMIIFLLATAGVITTTVLVGAAVWLVTGALELDVPLIYCLVFGALIAPTDPIAVLAILKQVGAPKSIEIKLAGESLFNDGIGVVVFFGLLRVAGHDTTPRPGTHESDLGDAFIGQAPEVARLFVHEVGGGLLVGFVLGIALVYLLRSIDDYRTEVLLALAGVTGGYVLCTHLHFSGPLAAVIAGLLVGNRGRSVAMSEKSAQRMDEFWELIDEILNAVLFVLIGLEVLIINLQPSYLLTGIALIPLVILARFISVTSVTGLLRRTQQFTPGAARVLTWAGLRGGISVALALSLKSKLTGELSVVGDLLVTMTYVVVCFSIIVQGLTVGPLVRKLGLAAPKPTVSPRL